MFVVTEETSLFGSEQQRYITDTNNMFGDDFKEEINGTYHLERVVPEPPAAPAPEAAQSAPEVKKEHKHQALIKNSTGSKIFEFLAKNKPSPVNRRPMPAAPVKIEEPVAPRRKLQF